MGDPTIIHNPLVQGIGIGSHASVQAGNDGSICCFVKKPGNADVYMMTCDHVLVVARIDNDHRVVQPGTQVNQVIGEWKQSFHPQPPSDGDSCLTLLSNARGYVNRTYSPTSGQALVNIPSVVNDSQLIQLVQTNAAVYKYGLTTRVTTGNIFAWPVTVRGSNGSVLFTDTIVVHGPQGGVWAAEGDSGSPLITTQGNQLVGINFEIEQGAAPPTGYAYPINHQMAHLGVTEYIAPPKLVRAEGTEIEDPAPQPEADPALIAQHTKLVNALNVHQPHLFGIPSVTHVGVGIKFKGGNPTQQLSIIVWVVEKKALEHVPEIHRIPPHLEHAGEVFPTDLQVLPFFSNPRYH